ncbi:beta-ketoacyl synthase [Gamsiella multidivaricata]|uniref:beta-ketoacyl synthase n=1 Tax=Gamsiella multidivaricata TaxID=101098 RepID=UPI00221EB0CB|nr:beta-ketoacyl synthase [Gamsiella multidivaricata]KAG0370339.1 Mitochondrial beta-keto-acyl synthase [Gamsiella multidivaricata]KAI7827456.1 beta-ketoacyl synthase [Gamsiella multidivaricata]
MAVNARRVVVTGLGLITPLGIGVQQSWSRLIAAECGVVSLKDHPSPSGLPGYDSLPSQVGAVVKREGGQALGGFDSTEWLERGDEKRMALFTQYAIAAAKMAIRDAQWENTTEDEKERTGVCLGSGIGSLDDMAATTLSFAESGYRKMSPMFVPKILINMAAGHLTMKFGYKGPNHAVSTACTTGAHSLGDAMRFIQYGDADVMIAGGSEACIHPMAVAGFSKAKSLATKYNDNPAEASRPFDRDRDGFVIGEGAGVVVLEEYEHAKKRGAHIYAELKGYGLSGDAHHMTAPPENGAGAAMAMRRALKAARLTPADVGYVNAHATSTQLGDIAENCAIKSVFDGHHDSIAVSSTKGAVGHLLGAAGAVEAIFTILAVKNNILPPTLNLHNHDDSGEFTLNYVPLKAQEKILSAALTNSFGFGGTNASLCFAKVD